MLKVVLDTNQFVSGIISKDGPSAKTLEEWKHHAYILIISKEIIAEINRTLSYPYIAQKYHITNEDIKSLITLLEHESVIISKTPKINVVKNDPDDNKIIACAICAEANYIVSGDKHLLTLQRYKNIAIVTAPDFLKILKANSN